MEFFSTPGELAVQGLDALTLPTPPEFNGFLFTMFCSSVLEKKAEDFLSEL